MHVLTLREHTLLNCRTNQQILTRLSVFIAPAGFRPKGRSLRRHRRSPRVGRSKRLAKDCRNARIGSTTRSLHFSVILRGSVNIHHQPPPLRCIDVCKKKYLLAVVRDYVVSKWVSHVCMSDWGKHQEPIKLPRLKVHRMGENLVLL